jgi:hypothetical protein
MACVLDGEWSFSDKAAQLLILCLSAFAGRKVFIRIARRRRIKNDNLMNLDRIARVLQPMSEYSFKTGNPRRRQDVFCPYIEYRVSKRSSYLRCKQVQISCSIGQCSH